MGQTRGRRRERKEKKNREDEQANEFDPSADFISLDGPQSFEDDQFPAGEDHEPGISNQAAFFGLLDRQELEYFKATESTLASNSLTADERGPFVANVFEEAKGKELKLVTNQVCSKLFERLVNLADEEQTRTLLEALTPQAVPLSIQKFASHCLEALIIKADNLGDQQGIVALTDVVEPQLETMVSDKYASHVLRTLLLVLSGSPTTVSEARSRKSNEARKHVDLEKAAVSGTTDIPDAYQKTVTHLLRKIRKDWDATTARRLAIDPVAGPVLQVVVRANGALANSDSATDSVKSSAAKFQHTVLDDENFITHCLSDSVGSHFVQTCIEVMNPKTLAKFYHKRLAGQLAKLAVQDLGNFVVQALVAKAQVGIRAEVVGEIIPIIPELVAARRWKLLISLVKSGGLELVEIKEAVSKAVNLSSATLASVDSPSQIELYSLLLAPVKPQSSASGPDKRDAQLEKLRTTFANNLWEAAAGLSESDITDMAKDPLKSHILEVILKSAPAADLPVRRRFLNSVVPLVPTLAVNVYGSHVVDALWIGVLALKFVRERVAAAIVEREKDLKLSVYGRLVWKNWHLDKYLYKRHEWWAMVKEEEISMCSGSSGVAKTPTPSAKALKAKAKHERSAHNGNDAKRRRVQA